MAHDPTISISTGAYYDEPLDAALARIAEIAAAAEVCSWGRHTLVHEEAARAVREAGLPVTVHGPFAGDGLGHWSAKRRRAALDVHRRHGAAAAELGAALYVVHPDMHTRRRVFDPKIAARLERSFAELLTLQEELGLAVLVENMPYAGHSHFTAPGQLDLQGLGLTLDIGHAALAGSLPSWLADPCAPLKHLHLHDNRGRHEGDLHLALGAGRLDLAPALALVRDAGVIVVLEHTRERDVLASLDYLRRAGLVPSAGDQGGRDRHEGRGGHRGQGSREGEGA